MDHAESLRALITDELAKDRPSFDLVKHYMAALREVLMRKAASQGPSLEDVDGFSDGALVASGNYAMRKYRDRGNDQMLAAMGDIAARSGPDPLAAILANLPTVESLYTPEERNVVRTQLRGLLDKRLLPPSSPLTVAEAEPKGHLVKMAYAEGTASLYESDSDDDLVAVEGP